MQQSSKLVVTKYAKANIFESLANCVGRPTPNVDDRWGQAIHQSQVCLLYPVYFWFVVSQTRVWFKLGLHASTSSQSVQYSGLSGPFNKTMQVSDICANPAQLSSSQLCISNIIIMILISYYSSSTPYLQTQMLYFILSVGLCILSSPPHSLISSRYSLWHTLWLSGDKPVRWASSHLISVARWSGPL